MKQTDLDILLREGEGSMLEPGTSPPSPTAVLVDPLRLIHPTSTTSNGTWGHTFKIRFLVFLGETFRILKEKEERKDKGAGIDFGQFAFEIRQNEFSIGYSRYDIMK